MAITKTAYIDQIIASRNTKISAMQDAMAAKASNVEPRDTRIDKIGHLEEMIEDTIDARVRGDMIEQLAKLQKQEEDDIAAIANYTVEISRLQAQVTELTRLKTA